MTGRNCLLIVLLFGGSSGSPAAAEDAPLSQRIDELITASELGPVAETADDATFLRRLSLDLIGRIPTRDEVEAFLGDESPDKRSRAVERLLAGAEYPRHMAVMFDLMLMERRGGKHVKSADFRKYLEGALAENRSYLELVREILSADGTDEKGRPAAAFYLEREVEPHLLTRDVGRVFFGIDLQCAQCHNHPLIDDYHQPDYYGLHAFFVRSTLFQADKKKPAVIAEQATGESDFKSVFTDREDMMRPRVPGGDELIEVTLKPTEQYKVAPAKNVRPVPTTSRLQQLAEAIVDHPTAAFNRNIVNRLWAHLFGRGLVDPVDLNHSANPPTHPEVLNLLADAFAEANYDVKWLLRELALTQAYQRSFRLPPLAASIEDAHQRIDAARASAESCREQAAEADQHLEALIERLDAALEAVKPFRDAEAAANKKVSEALKPRDAAQANVTKGEQDLAARNKEAELLKQSIDKTKAAAEALKSDNELAAALATIEKRAAAHAGAVEKAQTALQTGQSALEKAEETLQNASAAADEAIAARVPPEEAVRTLRAEMYATRADAQQLRTQASLAERDVTYLETLLSYDDSRQRIGELESAIAQHQQGLDDNATAITDAMQNEQAKRQAHAQSNEAFAKQQKKTATAAAARDAVQETRSQLAESVAQAEAAQQSLSAEDSVSDAIALLKDSLSRVDEKLATATAAVETEQEALKRTKKSQAAAEQTWTTSKEALAALQSKGTALRNSLENARKDLASTQVELPATWDELLNQSSARGNVAGLSALTPEQLGWSILTATGQYERQRASAAAKLNKEKPLSEEAAADAEALAARKREVDQAAHAALAGTIAKFVKLYGAAAGQPQKEFFATAEQSLFAANGAEMRSWLQPSGENLTARLLASEDDQQLAHELYVSVLARRPTAEEIGDVGSYLADRPDDRKNAVQELAWGLLTSAEFRFRF